MRNLSKNEKLRITRLGRGLTLKAVSKKVFLSESFIHLMEKGKRKVPDDVERVLDFDKGIIWYSTIIDALEHFSEDQEALKILNRVLKI